MTSRSLVLPLVLATVGIVVVSAVPRRRDAPPALEPASPSPPPGRDVLDDRPAAVAPEFPVEVMAPELLTPEAPRRAPNPAELVVEPVDPGQEPLRPMLTRAEVFRQLGVAYDADRVELGRRLFESTLLSADAGVGCVDCHRAPAGRIAPVVVVDEARTELEGRPAREVLGDVLRLHEFWTDREQAFDRLYASGSAEGEFYWSLWDGALARLAEDGYGVAFASTFREVERLEDLRPHHVLAAVDDYLLVADLPESAFDRFLRGDTQAIPPLAREGYQLFKDLGCADCHDGVNAGGGARSVMGEERGYFERARPLGVADLGRFVATGQPEDRHRFDVPALRDVARRAPYFHDRSQPTLRRAVQVMARHQLDLELAEWELERLVAFLESLTDVREPR